MTLIENASPTAASIAAGAPIAVAVAIHQALPIPASVEGAWSYQSCFWLCMNLR